MKTKVITRPLSAHAAHCLKTRIGKPIRIGSLKGILWRLRENRKRNGTWLATVHVPERFVD